MATLLPLPLHRATPPLPPAAAPRRHGVPGAGRLLDPIRETLRVWRERIGARDVLVRLTDRDLKDMGISGYDVGVEARKPFWRD